MNSATVLSAFGSSAGAFGAELGRWTTFLVVLAAVVVNAGIFLLVFLVSTAHPATIRELDPGGDHGRLGLT